MPRPTSAFFSSLFNINSGKHSDKRSSSSNTHSSDSNSGGQKRKKAETSDSNNGKKRRRASVFLTPPTVNPRESSLYRHCHYSTTFVTDHDTLDPHHPYNNTHPYASWPPRYPSTTDLYNLESNPSTYFPAPPPRTSDPIDKRHTAIWDDLFDWAESYQSSADSSRATSPGSEGPYTPSRLRCSTQIDLNETVAEQKKKNRRSGLFSLSRLGMKSEIWSKKDTFDMAASTEPTLPIIPPRSRLRAQAPPPINSRSTSYLLPVDEPLYASPQTPALSPGPSSQGSPNQLPTSPASDLPSLGRNKKKSYAGLGQDPMKIRDGALPRRSSSGVYTPPTFPGAQGPSPSHYPTHVYTPPGFSLGQPRPTPSNYTYAPAGPSRSASVSSADSEGPTTPGTNPGRLSSFSGKALTGLKRLSHQVTSNVSPLPVKQPISARDSYFPSSIGTDVHRVYDSPNTPTTPRATSFGPAFATQSTNSLGLGVGLTESEGRTHGTSPKSAEMSETSTEMSNKSSPSTRTKRKPVPRMLDDQLAARMNGLRVDDVPHAL